MRDCDTTDSQILPRPRLYLNFGGILGTCGVTVMAESEVYMFILLW